MCVSQIRSLRSIIIQDLWAELCTVTQYFQKHCFVSLHSSKDVNKMFKSQWNNLQDFANRVEGREKEKREIRFTFPRTFWCIKSLENQFLYKVNKHFWSQSHSLFGVLSVKDSLKGGEAMKQTNWSSSTVFQIVIFLQMLHI